MREMIDEKYFYLIYAAHDPVIKHRQEYSLNIWILKPKARDVFLRD